MINTNKKLLSIKIAGEICSVTVHSKAIYDIYLPALINISTFNKMNNTVILNVMSDSSTLIQEMPEALAVGVAFLVSREECPGS